MHFTIFDRMRQLVANIKYALAKMAIAMLLFSICRLLFFTFNYSYFGSLKLIHLWGGIRFDWMTITILYAPFLLSLLFDFRTKSKLRKVLFHLSNTLAIVFNCMDFEYYKFTFKRTTADLFYTDGIGQDVFNLLPRFILDYWYVVVLGIILIGFSSFLYRKTESLAFKPIKFPLYLGYFFPLFVFYFIGFRGGIQLKPLNVIQAGQYAQAKDIPIVLNTPFTIIKSSYKEEIESRNYFAKEKLEKIYSPVSHFEADSTAPKLNVVLIIMESFAKEYIGAFNEGDGYTPFLDQLIEKSLVFENSFANGKKSIEALPSILAGVPTLMNTSYISSKYGSNRIRALGKVLNDRNYRTVFYHGGENGTMGFDAFANMAGINEYKGRNEYPLKGDYDGNWGIFDEPFLAYCVDDLSNGNAPFFASIFTLSSHHPYTIPEEHKGQFSEGPLPILKSVRYADYALEQFFEKAKTTDWFDQTLFIITADHTSQSFKESYNNRFGMYSIPILFYSPSYVKAERKAVLCQQTDLFPSIIDFLGFEEEILSFGNSVFDTESEPFVINYLNGLYQYTKGDYVLHFDGNQSVALYAWKQDPALKNNLIGQQLPELTNLENELKALLQQYVERLTQNQLIP